VVFFRIGVIGLVFSLHTDFYSFGNLGFHEFKKFGCFNGKSMLKLKQRKVHIQKFVLKIYYEFRVHGFSCFSRSGMEELYSPEFQ
jgi:hypothetical protein